MAGEDLYGVLGLERSASVAAVKKAYKKLAKKYHPDLNPGDKSAEDRFKKISEAYAILSDPEKKKQYDTFGRVGGQAPPPGYGVNFNGFDSEAGSAGGFQDLFESFLHTAHSRDRVRPSRGQDLVFPVNITLEEAYRGKKTRLKIRHLVSCSNCGGTGRSRTASLGPCRVCGGSGKENISQGPFSFSRICSRCGGDGKEPGPVCRTCGGRGAREAEETVSVTIPAGVDTGSKVRLKGKGQAGLNGGTPGDLYIETNVIANNVFRREGKNLKVTVPITIVEASLGARVEVPTIGASAMMKVPPGTSSGQVFRLKERGMPALRGGGKGDLLVEVKIVTPSVIDEKSKELLREFQKLHPENPRQLNSDGKGGAHGYRAAK